MKLDKRRELRKACMPAVKKLVAHFGRTIVAGCLNKLKDQDKIRSRINRLRKEAEELEKRI